MPRKYQRKEFLKMTLLTNLCFLSKPLQALAAPVIVKAVSSSNVQYLKKGDADYETLRKGFNKRINKYPAIIALCANTAGVSEAVKYAAAQNLPVAIKSGGHCMEGFSVNNDGMVINLSQLRSISWVDANTIKVGPGCTLSALYDELLPKGKILPGGSCASVGIGGLVLGGGYGLMARLFGLTCDSLLGVTMVDGMGNIRNSDDDKELLWACRGGGNGNFGVVTELVFKVHKAPATMQSWRFKTHHANTAKVKAILEKWFELTPKLPPACFSAFVQNGKTVYILLTNTSKLTPAVQEVINGLGAVSEKISQTKPMPLAKALKVFYGRPAPLYFKNASAGLYKDFTQVQPYIDKVLDMVIASPGMIYQVNTLGGNIINPGFEAGAAFPHRGFPFFSELQAYWEGEKQGQRLMEKFGQVQDVFNNNGITAQYRNYPDIRFKNFDSLYYGSSYGRLQAVKRMYDPKNIIRHEQSVKG
jgi:hypothetical protein